MCMVAGGRSCFACHVAVKFQLSSTTAAAENASTNFSGVTPPSYVGKGGPRDDVILAASEDIWHAPQACLH